MAHGVAAESHAASIAAFEEPYNTASVTLVTTTLTSGGIA